MPQSTWSGRRRRKNGNEIGFERASDQCGVVARRRQPRNRHLRDASQLGECHVLAGEGGQTDGRNASRRPHGALDEPTNEVMISHGRQRAAGGLLAPRCPVFDNMHHESTAATARCQSPTETFVKVVLASSSFDRQRCAPPDSRSARRGAVRELLRRLQRRLVRFSRFNEQAVARRSRRHPSCTTIACDFSTATTTAFSHRFFTPVTFLLWHVSQAGSEQQRNACGAAV